MNATQNSPSINNFNNSTNQPMNSNQATQQVSQANNQNTKGLDTTQPKKKMNLKMVLGIVVLLLVILGSGAGFYLTQYTNQDLRQQAYVGQSCTKDSDCSNSNEVCDASGSCIVPPTTGICTPNSGCEYSCTSSHPTNVKINCNLPESDCGTTRKTDICRGKATGANCQLCEKKSGGYACPGDALKDANCDYSCACPTADQEKCYESGPGHSSGKETPGYDCKNIQKDVIYDGSGIWNCRSEDGRAWDECNPEDVPLVCNDACTTTAECQSDLGADYSCVSNKCRLTSNPTSATCQPPEDVPLVCNDACTTTAECQSDLGADYSCVSNKCRLTANPTSATCTPENLMCQDIAVLDANDNDEVTDNFYIGQALALRCRSTEPSTTLHHYEFMVSLDGKVIISKDSSTNIDPTGTTAISLPFNVEAAGDYEAACRVCTSATECEPFTAISTPPTIPGGNN